MGEKLIVLGGGDLARDIAWWVLETLPDAEMVFVDPSSDRDSFDLSGTKIEIIRHWDFPTGFLRFIVGVSDPEKKRDLVFQAGQNGYLPKPTFIHKDTVVAEDANIFPGGVIGPNCRIGLNTEINCYVTIGPRCEVGHDSVIDAFSTLHPGCIISGHCRVGIKVVIGAGSVLREGITVNSNNTIGLQSGVISDLSGIEKTYGGVPAREIN